ncbi:hypothetical protein H6G35_22445 [Aulosira sp. FACHB-113]|uniref:hypothetical protein n=1 Tax=Tolypothrix tenuis TaxID=457083 RepID=UPI00168A33DF|nr:hypothetical protein [Aulosira sp. FACHB-113]
MCDRTNEKCQSINAIAVFLLISKCQAFPGDIARLYHNVNRSSSFQGIDFAIALLSSTPNS